MKHNPISPGIRNSMLWALMAAAGIFTIFSILRYPSEAGSAILFGYSPSLLLAASAAGAVSLILFFGLAASLSQWDWLRRFTGAVGRLLHQQWSLGLLLFVGFTAILAITALQILAGSPAANEAVILKSLMQRFWMLFVWMELILLGLALLIWMNFPDQVYSLLTPSRLALLFLISTVVYLAAVKVFARLTWDIRFRGMEYYIFLPAAVFLVWAWVYEKYHQRGWYARVSSLLLTLSIAAVVFTVYRHTSQLAAWHMTPSKAYWHLLADAMLNGRLYLINPGTTHDLTFFNNQWYVPNPPLPALLLIPFVAILGVHNINTVLFSIVLGVVTTLLIFWLLESAAQRNILPTSRRANLWLTAAFAFGTCFWWLSIMGRMWFLSQVVTVLFTALAALLAVRQKSPWLVGACLGLAILARPNVFTIYPFLLGITLFFQQRDNGKIRWGSISSWAVQSAVPVCLSIFGLLFYNQIRFDSFLDFGYVTINSAEWLMESVRTYGMFHPHFIPSNFAMMFLNHPQIISENGCLRWAASRDGYSMFAMTPIIVYALRRFQKNWWVLGAWVSVLLSIALLLLYHNNGAWQLGYRYLMDFIVPLLFLMAIGVGAKVSWVFKALAAASILSSTAGILWWFEKWWC